MENENISSLSIDNTTQTKLELSHDLSPTKAIELESIEKEKSAIVFDPPDIFSMDDFYRIQSGRRHGPSTVCNDSI